MQRRVLVPELMDDPNLDEESHLTALRALRRINRWTGTTSLLWRWIWRLARHADGLRVLDVATGAADIPIRLSQWATARGLNLELHACDMSERALAFAAEQCHRAGVDIQLFKLDVVEDELPSSYHIVMCSQFLHHLPDDQVEQVLKKMCQAARERVLVVDLVRSPLNWLQVWLGTRLLSRSSIVHFDGPQSIRAAFTRAEIGSIAERAGFVRFEISHCWPCRFTLVGEVLSHA